MVGVVWQRQTWKTADLVSLYGSVQGARASKQARVWARKGWQASLKRQLVRSVVSVGEGFATSRAECGHTVVVV